MPMDGVKHAHNVYSFGPYGANIFSPTEWGGGGHADGITLEVTRVVIALSVFAIGVELPRAYVLRHWKSLVFLLGPVMLVGWMVSGAFIYALIPKLNFLDSLVIAAVSVIGLSLYREQ